jgi:hypothetical protein
MRELRTILGFVAAPLVPGLLFGLVGEFSAGSVGLLWCLKFSAALGYPVAIILGVPLYLIYRRYRVESLIAYVMTGLGLGVVPFLIAVLPGTVAASLGVDKNSAAVWPAMGSILWYLPISMACGAAAAAAFWLIAHPLNGSQR